MEKGKIRVAQMIGSVFEGGVESCIMNYFSSIDVSKVTFDFYVDRASKIIDQKKIEDLKARYPDFIVVLASIFSTTLQNALMFLS